MSVLLEISEAKAIHWKTAELAGPGKWWRGSSIVGVEGVQGGTTVEEA
jgi:hypothetical protein